MGRVIFLGGSIKVILNNGFCIFKLSSFTKHRSTLGRSLHHTITWFANPSRGSKCPELSWQGYSKVGCVFLMVVVAMLFHVEIGRNDHREDAPHFMKLSRQRNWTYSWSTEIYQIFQKRWLKAFLRSIHTESSTLVKQIIHLWSIMKI